MFRKLSLAALVGAIAVALLAIGGVFGSGSASPARVSTVVKPGGDRLADSIARAQQRLRDVPGDWPTRAALGSAYLEQGRITADPTYYPKAEGAARRSLEIHPDGNADALVALATLAAARHDFTGARDKALAAMIRAGHSFEQALTLALSRDGGAERSSQPSKHTGLEEKALQGLWLGREHLGEEIVLQRRLSAREDAYKRLDLSRCG